MTIPQSSLSACIYENSKEIRETFLKAISSIPDEGLIGLQKISIELREKEVEVTIEPPQVFVLVNDTR